MFFPLFIARRIAFNRQKTFSRFIVRLSIAATAISVTVMIVTLAFVNGFRDVVSEKMFSFWGQVRVQYAQPGRTEIAEETPIENDPALVRWMRAQPGVTGVQPFATKSAILKTDAGLEGVVLKGLDRSADLHRLDLFLLRGRWIQFTDSTYSRQIAISEYTANALGLDTGSRVYILFIRPDGSLRPDRLTVIGVFKTGIEQYDRNFAIGDMALIRRLNGWDSAAIGGYEVYLRDYADADRISNEIFERRDFPAAWETKTVRELRPETFDWLNIVSDNGRILLTIVALMVAINFLTCLFILVLERIRMIGVLKALGASNGSVQTIFLLQNLFITLSGIVLGLVVGYGIIWAQQRWGFIRLKEDQYFMSTAAMHLPLWQTGVVVIGTALLSLLVLIIPSLIVWKVQPVRAIRFA